MNQNNIVLTGDLIGLDLGASRVGVARISTFAKIPEPLEDIKMSDNFIIELQNVISKYSAKAVIAGVPRNLEGVDTEQTRWAKIVIGELEAGLEIPVFSVDEAGTTKEAEDKAFPNQSVDGVAAGIILEDFIKEIDLGNFSNVSL